MPVSTGGPAYESLNPKQQAFVMAYLTEPNATTAAISAGYSKKTAGAAGARALKHEGIAAAITAGHAHLDTVTMVDAIWVRDSLVQIVKKCMQLVKVVNKRGEPTGETRIDAAGATRALELLGRHVGFIQTGSDGTGKDGPVAKVQIVVNAAALEAKGPEVVELGSSGMGGGPAALPRAGVIIRTEPVNESKRSVHSGGTGSTTENVVSPGSREVNSEVHDRSLDDDDQPPGPGGTG